MRETSMTEENEPFSFATPFTVPDVEPVSVSAPEAEEKTIEDLDSIIEDVDWFGIKKSAEYSGRRYRIVPSKRHQAWFLYLGRKK